MEVFMSKVQDFSGETCENNAVDYICTECKYILKNGELMAREICPECKAINPFIIFNKWHH